MKKYFSLFAALIAIFLLPACKTTYYELKPIPAYKPLNAKNYAKAACYAIYPMPEHDEPDEKEYTFKPSPAVPEKMLMEAFQRNHYNARDFSRCLSLNELDQVQHVIQVLQLEACQHKVEDGYAVTYHLVVSVRPPHTLRSIRRSRCFQVFHRIWLPENEKNMKETRQFFLHPGKDLLFIEYSDTLDKSYRHYFEPQYMTPLFDNLFMNPAFRKALQPNKIKSGRK